MVEEAVALHRELAPGPLEFMYEVCLAEALEQRGCNPIYLLGCDYRFGIGGDHHAHRGGRRYEYADFEGLRIRMKRTLHQLRARFGVEIINVSPWGPNGTGPHGTLTFGPWSELLWEPTIDLRGFDLRTGRTDIPVCQK